MAIYTQKGEQKWLKINNRVSWNKDVLGGKNRKINSWGGMIIHDARVISLVKGKYNTSQRGKKQKK